MYVYWFISFIRIWKTLTSLNRTGLLMILAASRGLTVSAKISEPKSFCRIVVHYFQIFSNKTNLPSLDLQAERSVNCMGETPVKSTEQVL